MQQQQVIYFLVNCSTEEAILRANERKTVDVEQGRHLILERVSIL